MVSIPITVCQCVLFGYCLRWSVVCLLRITKNERKNIIWVQAVWVRHTAAKHNRYIPIQCVRRRWNTTKGGYSTLRLRAIFSQVIFSSSITPEIGSHHWFWMLHPARFPVREDLFLHGLLPSSDDTILALMFQSQTNFSDLGKNTDWRQINAPARQDTFNYIWAFQKKVPTQTCSHPRCTGIFKHVWSYWHRLWDEFLVWLDLEHQLKLVNENVTAGRRNKT